MAQNVHSLISKKQQEQLDIIKWCYAVADMRADSPRFAYYVSRWRVPEKIKASKDRGDFDQVIANCPPIDPAWIRFVPAALAAYEDFIKPRPPTDKPAFSTHAPPKHKPPRRVA